VTDDDVVRWYAEQRLPSEALARLRGTHRSRNRLVWALAAALVLGFGVGAAAVWSRPTPTLTATPIAYADPLPIPPEAQRALELPPGMLRTEVPIPDGAALAGLLNPGNYVDVQLTRRTPDRPPETRTLLQSVFVLEVPPGTPPRVALLTTAEQDRQLGEAARQGEIVVTLRNDLDVSYPPLPGVEVDALRSQMSRSLVPRTRDVPWPEPGPSAVERGAGGVNWTAEDPVSTFSMDVDTASYSLSRAELDGGRRPDPARVRVEEYVNALPYDYPAPETGLFSASFEAAPSPWTEGYDLVRVGLRAREAATRDPLHLTFLIDTSCSMASQVGLVKRSLHTLVDSLEPVDTVAVVRFSDTASVVLPPTAARDPSVRSALDGLRADGSTALQAGLVAAYTAAASRLGPPGVHRVVLCTDGMPNIGDTEAEALSSRIRPWTEQGIGLTALGFGRGGYRDDLMEAFADASDGNYAYVDTDAEARRVLADRVLQTLLTVARDAKIQVAWDPSTVQSWRLVGYDDRALTDDEFRDDTADAGEVGSGQQVTALYEVHRTGRTGTLGTLRIRAQPAVEQVFPIPGQRHPTLDQASSDTRIAAAAGSLALLLADSPISRLDPGRIFALAQAARRPGHAADDAGLLAMIRAAATASPYAPTPRRCREFSIISGGQKKIILVDDNGIPCEPTRAAPGDSPDVLGTCPPG
jgi:Ca-activated chloride channel homolog